MAQTLVSSLKKLVREKRRIKEMEQEVARTERRVIERIGRSLSGTGYRLVPVSSGHSKVAMPGTTTRAKRLRCPKCDRRFAHRLPMARHVSAAHGRERTTEKAAKKATARK